MLDIRRKKAIAASLCSMVSVQSGASIAKILFHHLGAGGAASLRTGFAGLILLLLNRPNIRKITREQWLCILFYGISTGAMNLIFYYGVQRIPLGVGVTVEYLGPLGLALIRSRKATDFLWALLAGLGVFLIVPWSKQQTANGIDPIGLGLVFLAGVMWASYIVAGRTISHKMKSSDAAACGMCVASVLILPFGIFSGDLFHLTWKLTGLGVCVALLSSVFTFTLDLYALKDIPSKVFSVFQSLQPAVAATAGLIFLREYLSITQCLAIFFVIVASMGAALSSD